MGVLPSGARPAVVLVGASNMTRGLGVLRTLAARAWGAPLDILAAIGLGRSFGLMSSVLGRRLPPVLECGLWPALETRRPPGLVAFVGDVGNDLLYGQDVDTILRWVEECVARLRARGARIVLTSLPPGVREISRARFLLFRSALYPLSPLRFESLAAALPALDDGLRQIASRHGAAFVPLRRAWYGVDPVHIRAGRAPGAWAEVVSAAAAALPPGPTASVARSLRTYTLLAERQWLFGREVTRAQPVLRQRDGTTVALY